MAFGKRCDGFQNMRLFKQTVGKMKYSINWKTHVNHIASKISSAIGMLYVVHTLFPLPILM